MSDESKAEHFRKHYLNEPIPDDVGYELHLRDMQNRELQIALAAANEQIAKLQQENEQLNNHTVWLETRNQVLAEGRNTAMTTIAKMETEIANLHSSIAQLEDIVREALADAEGELGQTNNHPASRHAKTVEMYRDVLGITPQKENPNE